MATPAWLTRGLLRALPFVDRGIAEGLSANAIGRALAAEGLGVQRSVLLRYIREARGLEARSDYFRALRTDARPDPNRLPEALTKLRRNYSTRVKVRGYDSQTGQEVTRYFTVSSDLPLTKDEAIEDILAQIEEDDERYPLEVEEATALRQVRAGPRGTLL